MVKEVTPGEVQMLDPDCESGEIMISYYNLKSWLKMLLLKTKKLLDIMLI